jgi:hypothetical protein
MRPDRVHKNCVIEPSGLSAQNPVSRSSSGPSSLGLRPLWVTVFPGAWGPGRTPFSVGSSGKGPGPRPGPPWATQAGSPDRRSVSLSGAGPLWDMRAGGHRPTRSSAAPGLVLPGLEPAGPPGPARLPHGYGRTPRDLALPWSSLGSAGRSKARSSDGQGRGHGLGPGVDAEAPTQRELLGTPCFEPFLGPRRVLPGGLSWGPAGRPLGECPPEAMPACLQRVLPVWGCFCRRLCWRQPSPGPLSVPACLPIMRGRLFALSEGPAGALERRCLAAAPPSLPIAVHGLPVRPAGSLAGCGPPLSLPLAIGAPGSGSPGFSGPWAWRLAGASPVSPVPSGSGPFPVSPRPRPALSLPSAAADRCKKSGP